jgi:hypothetical protein
MFNRRLRKRELREFALYWRRRELESIAFRLAARELREAHGLKAAWWAVTLCYLPREMISRASVYQLNAEFKHSVAAYRRKLGLPPQELRDGPRPPS